MSRIFVVGEDALSLAFAERMIEQVLPGWVVAGSRDMKGITRLVASLQRYVQLADYVQPVLCVADSDGKCAADLVAKWGPARAGRRFLFRLAEPETESWLLADAQACSDGLGVSAATVPRDPDVLSDAKGTLLRLARQSKVRLVREEVVSQRDPTRPGSGYNVHLCEVVRTRWQAVRAERHSPSLRRALLRLRSLG